MNVPRMRCPLLVLFWLGLGFEARVAGQAAGHGTVEGRVSNPATGAYLETARVTVEGTGLETFTDSTGFFRLTEVPAGTVRVRVFFTGLAGKAATVNVAAGQTAQSDFALELLDDGPGKDRTPVKLDRYVVAESQQMEGAAIAINEQRFASNMKVVVAADEFGAASENDVGEFLKFLPGVSMDYLAGDARQVSLGGVEFNYTPVTFGGFGMTNGNQGGTNRGVSLEYVSLNNVSRVEVINSPTPESPGAALAGSINFVPRSAFERIKPQLIFSTYLSMRDDQRDFHKSVGPREQKTRKVMPGVEFSYVFPINRRFGVTVAGSASLAYSARDSFVNTWRGGNAVTNGNAFPDTTPQNPYLTSYIIRDGFLVRKRSSYSATFDYRLAANDRISLSLTRSTYNTNYEIRGLTFAIDRVNPGSFSSTFSRGAAGQGQLTASSEVRDRNTTTFMPTLVYRHDGPTWKAEAGAAYSRSRDHTSSIDRGWFAIPTLRRTNLTISFEDITELRPGRIVVADGTTGAPVDPFNISTYSLASVAGPTPKNTDVKRSVYAHLRRDFDVRNIPITLKAGLDLQNQVRDNVNRYPANTTIEYHGRDGRSSTTPVGNDDSAAPFYYSEIATRPMILGFPAIPQVNPMKVLAFFKENSNQFRMDANAAYRAPITFSKYAEETVTSAFVRGDVAFLERRLKLVGGVRAEQTNIEADGPLTDPTRAFQRRPDGSFILGPNGRPLLIVPTNAGLPYSQLTFLERGSHVEKEYLRWFPSLNASFNVRENLVARAAFYTSIGRPNFNQYAGGITLPDSEADPSASNRITVNNASIKPWSAKTVSMALEYYFAKVGTVSISAYRREFKNFFGTALLAATPEFLEIYSLDPAVYGDYDVSTQRNLSDTVRMDGVTFSYKQALTFLPAWARGVQVFANGTSQHASGAASGKFQYSPRLFNAGASLTRRNFSLRVDVSHRGRQFVSSLTGRGIQADTNRYSAARTSIDLTGEHVLWRQLRLFAKLRNVTDVGVDFDFYGPLTPEHARFQQRERYGALWTFGVKGTW